MAAERIKHKSNNGNPPIRTLLKYLDSLSRIVAATAAIVTVSIAVVIISEIIARSVFNYSFSFAWEYSAYAMGIAMFCGAAFTLRTGGHIRVSLLQSILPNGAIYGVDIVCTVLGVLISGILAYSLSMLAWGSFLSGSTSPTISATPLIIPQGLIAFGAGLLALQMLARLIRLILKESPEDNSTSYQVE
tara:strand:- start:479 stop:1045 length:567 start_codon:yes stop_codon:yes gene_type:complete